MNKSNLALLQNRFFCAQRLYFFKPGSFLFGNPPKWARMRFIEARFLAAKCVKVPLPKLPPITAKDSGWSDSD